MSFRKCANCLLCYPWPLLVGTPIQRKSCSHELLAHVSSALTEEVPTEANPEPNRSIDGGVKLTTTTGDESQPDEELNH